MMAKFYVCRKPNDLDVNNDLNSSTFANLQPFCFMYVTTEAVYKWSSTISLIYIYHLPGPVLQSSRAFSGVHL